VRIAREQQAIQIAHLAGSPKGYPASRAARDAWFPDRASRVRACG
jgi:hypothetical protein